MAVSPFKPSPQIIQKDEVEVRPSHKPRPNKKEKPPDVNRKKPLIQKGQDSGRTLVKWSKKESQTPKTPV
ncbi:uncharacterized protein G2W53_007393 [Senna tora]|uniref:Uncharacterized protein n=1 Tax=Senna tora TaxID=362788 RepID=A0A834X628_9FABA|nr:uncharacterized protein G2W53_007393 [Senna tora]